MVPKSCMANLTYFRCHNARIAPKQNAATKFERTSCEYNAQLNMSALRYLVLFVVCLPAFGQVFDGHNPQQPNLSAKAFLLFDTRSGIVLAEKNADKRIEPASLTKLMTAYVVFDALRQKHLTMTQRVRVSEQARHAPGSRMFLEQDSEVSIEDLLKGLIVQSGNDAAITLAEAIANSETEFVVLMNREAQRLGMNDTRFANSTGLPDVQHYSTARDIVRITAVIISEFPEHFPLYGMHEFTYNDVTQYNRNKLLGRDPYVDGMKTGFTESAGFCLVATAQRDGRRLISVVIDSGSDNGRTAESQSLLNYGFEAFDTMVLFNKGQAVHEIPVWKGDVKSLPAGFTDDFFVTVPAGLARKLTAKLESMQPLLAPVQAGQHIGTLKLSFDGNQYGDYSVVALKSVRVGNVFVRTWHSLRLLLNEQPGQSR
jgi:D-alanyl-D-alanine carboxypeptidase (penicillin-binding protein 5/6)